MTNQPIDRVLARLEAVHSSGDQNWIARCPAHDDRNPSLSVGVGREGRVLLKCHAGCDHHSILEALELSPRDLFAEIPEEPCATRVEIVAFAWHRGAVAAA
ncbi:MAG: hypothetical protein O2930_14430 [Acidobacteria bacterium]|nr:hypothetical protein [Acidobacteriota bacterium]